MARSPATITSKAARGGEGSTLGRGTRVRGRVSGEGALRIEGEVEGDVTVSGDLSIEDGGSVTGDIGAASLVIHGALKGDVDARGPVAVRAGANVLVAGSAIFSRPHPLEAAQALRAAAREGRE